MIRPVRVLVKGWGVVDVTTDDVVAAETADVEQAIRYGVTVDDPVLMAWEVEETND